MANGRELQVARGQIQGEDSFNRQGICPNVDGEFHDVWSYEKQSLVYQTEPNPLVFVSDSDEDWIGGQGARLIFLQGIDENFDEVEETIVPTGESPVQSVNSYIRLLRAVVIQTGVYGGSNIGNITVYPLGKPGEPQGQIVAGTCRTTGAHYSTDRHTTAYLQGIEISGFEKDEFLVDFYLRTNYDRVVEPFGADILIDSYHVRNGFFSRTLRYPLRIAPLRDMIFKARGKKKDSGSLVVAYQLLTVLEG